MGTIKTTNIEPIADNGTVTLGSSGDTFTIPSGVTVAGAMANTPAFVAYKTSDQSISHATETKVTFTGEQLDTDSTYDTGNSRFTPGVAGYYFIGAFWRYNTGTDFSQPTWSLFKNGTKIQSRIGTNTSLDGYNYNYITYSDADDYFEMFGYQNSGSSVNINGAGGYQSNQSQGYFYAYRIIGI